MKKLFVLACLCMLSAQGFAAGTSAQVTVTSDYNWRGLSWTGTGVGAVQGSISYNTDFGLGGGLWASNLAIGHQMNQFIYYAFKAGPVGLTAMVNNFTYSDPKMSAYNSTDISVKGDWKGLWLLVSDMPDYFGTKTSDLYVNLGYQWQITPEFSFIPSIGSTNFADAKKTASLSALGYNNDNYIDWKLAIDHTKDGVTLELAFTDTNRENISATGVKTKIRTDYKSYVSLSKTF